MNEMDASERYRSFKNAVAVYDEYLSYVKTRKNSGMSYKSYSTWLCDMLQDARAMLDYEIDHTSG